MDRRNKKCPFDWFNSFATQWPYWIVQTIRRCTCRCLQNEIYTVGGKLRNDVVPLSNECERLIGIPFTGRALLFVIDEWRKPRPTVAPNQESWHNYKSECFDYSSAWHKGPAKTATKRHGKGKDKGKTNDHNRLPNLPQVSEQQQSQNSNKSSENGCGSIDVPTHTYSDKSSCEVAPKDNGKRNGEEKGKGEYATNTKLKKTSKGSTRDDVTPRSVLGQVGGDPSHITEDKNQRQPNEHSDGNQNRDASTAPRRGDHKSGTDNNTNKTGASSNETAKRPKDDVGLPTIGTMTCKSTTGKRWSDITSNSSLCSHDE